MLDTLSYLESAIGPTMVGSKKSFQNRGFGWLENAILTSVFANTVNTSLNYTFFQLSYKHDIAFNSSKISNFDDVLTQFYLNFLLFPMLGVVHPTTPPAATSLFLQIVIDMPKLNTNA